MIPCPAAKLSTVETAAAACAYVDVNGSVPSRFVFEMGISLALVKLRALANVRLRATCIGRPVRVFTAPRDIPSRGKERGPFSTSAERLAEQTCCSIMMHVWHVTGGVTYDWIFKSGGCAPFPIISTGVTPRKPPLGISLALNSWPAKAVRVLKAGRPRLGTERVCYDYRDKNQPGLR